MTTKFLRLNPTAGALAAFLLLAAAPASAQRDSLVLNTGDVIVGELKSLDAGVATIETD
jgi:hypothetical protein